MCCAGFRSFPLIRAHQIKKQMKWKPWVGDCRQNLPEGEQQAQTRSSGTVPPPLLPAPEKLSPGHKAEKNKKEVLLFALWVP